MARTLEREYRTFWGWHIHCLRMAYQEARLWGQSEAELRAIDKDSRRG